MREKREGTLNKKSLVKTGVAVLVVLVVFAVLQKTVSVDKIFQAGGIVALAAAIFAETGLLIGFFLPGDTLLFAAGFFAAQGKLNLTITLISLFVAAVLGNLVGYEIGRRGGRQLFDRPDSFVFHKENVDKAQAFFAKHGGKTIIFARFIPIIRTLSSPLAGTAGMDRNRFMIYNFIGAAAWVPTITLIGYWAGKVLGRFINIDRYVLPAVLLATLATFGISFLHLWRDPVSRAKLKQKFQKL